MSRDKSVTVESNEELVHGGHRSRMRSKLLSHGQRIFDTYELLEMLLYHAIPYKDTNPTAKRLLKAFDGLEGVFGAEKEELVSVVGVGEHTADMIKAVGRLKSLLGAELLPRHAMDFSDYNTVGEYFVNYFSDSNNKRVAAIFLDNNMRLIESRTVYELEYESGGVRAKPFIDIALKNHASVVITAHNHPFGPFYPMPGDRATNNVISSALSMVGLMHAEHYIICGNSFAGIGSLSDFTNKVSQTPKISGFLAGKERAFEKLDGLSLGTVNKGKDYAPPLPNMNIRDMDYFASLLAYAGEPEDVALRLLERYQTIEGVLTAKSDELIQMSSEKCTFLIKNLAFVTSRRTTELFEPGVKYTPAQIAEYLKALYIGVSVEQAYLLTFDENGGYIDCTLIGEGTVNSSELLPRKAIEIAVSKSAHSVAIAHNHPFGNPSPSADDLKSTNQLERLFKSCEIGFTCHYIIAGQRCEIVMGKMDISENEECLKEM